MTSAWGPAFAIPAQQPITQTQAFHNALMAVLSAKAKGQISTEAAESIIAEMVALWVANQVNVTFNSFFSRLLLEKAESTGVPFTLG